MAGIHLTGGKPYQFITESISAGTLTITTPNNTFINCQALKIVADEAAILSDPAAGLSFFTNASTPQQPTPVTLADVITVLQAFGLTS